MINENSEKTFSLDPVDAVVSESQQKTAIKKKFKRAIRRLVLLSRAAKKQGIDNFNIGGLVFEVTTQKDNQDKNELPTAWIEIVISQLNMKELISDTVLKQVNEQISVIKDKTKKQAIVFEILKQEVMSINFP